MKENEKKERKLTKVKHTKLDTTTKSKKRRHSMGGDL
jgi:hypothetical protein